MKSFRRRNARVVVTVSSTTTRVDETPGAKYTAMENFHDTFGACLNFWQCLLPVSAYEEVHIGSRRFKIIRQVSYKTIFTIVIFSIGLLHGYGAPWR